jgi:hypothetical protein
VSEGVNEGVRLRPNVVMPGSSTLVSSSTGSRCGAHAIISESIALTNCVVEA